MLRNFVYLDSKALSQYVTAIEGGQLTEAKKRSVRSGAATGGVDLKVARAEGKRASEDEDSRTFADSDEAKFDRLLAAAADNPDALGWIEVMEPDTDLAAASTGVMVHWECEIFVPDAVQILRQSAGAIGMMQNLLPAARSLGLDTTGLPTDAEMNSMADFINQIDVRLVVVGEDDNTEWQVAGDLRDECLRGELEGRARLVGKVSKVIVQGKWKPFVSFPGMNLLPRKQRREMEQRPPEQGKEDEYLQGPALMLDVLAIYR